MSDGRSTAEGPQSNPLFEQLTTEEFWGPTTVHEQFLGQGLHIPNEPQASRQHSEKSRLEKNPKFEK